MKLGLVALFTLAAVSTASADTNMTCKATSDADIKGLFDRWNNSLKTGNADVHFLEDKPVGEINMRVIKIGCNDAIDAGIYTFTFGNGDKVRARYTYTYTLHDRKWLISSHHSSTMPEKSE